MGFLSYVWREPACITIYLNTPTLLSHSDSELQLRADRGPQVHVLNPRSSASGTIVGSGPCWSMCVFRSWSLWCVISVAASLSLHLHSPRSEEWSRHIQPRSFSSLLHCELESPLSLTRNLTFSARIYKTVANWLATLTRRGCFWAFHSSWNARTCTVVPVSPALSHQGPA